MLRIIQNNSAAGAKSYYTTADYHTEGQELQGIWHGEGAARLGLTRLVQKEQWDALCDNLHPKTGEALTLRTKTDRLIGYDFNFHVPKSVSMLYSQTQDESILEAFRSAVDETMHEMEAEMKTRVRKKGQNEDRTTGNMVWGSFVHFTSRPVDNIPDPHLHAHCFVFNMTWDEQENAWKAGQFANFERDAPYFEAAFQSKFANACKDWGLKSNAPIRDGDWRVSIVRRSRNSHAARRRSNAKPASGAFAMLPANRNSVLKPEEKKSPIFRLIHSGMSGIRGSIPMNGPSSTG